MVDCPNGDLTAVLDPQMAEYLLRSRGPGKLTLVEFELAFPKLYAAEVPPTKVPATPRNSHQLGLHL